MFTKIGRFIAWYPFNFPVMRRLAKQNPKDVGKLVVYGWGINVLVIGAYWIGIKWLINRAEMQALSLAADVDSTFDADEHEANNGGIAFEKRFGTLHKGDEVTFNTGRENITAPFVRYSDKGNLIVNTESGEFIVQRADVLDVDPAF